MNRSRQFRSSVLAALVAAPIRASAEPAKEEPSPVRVTAYLQTQVESHQDSENQLRQGGQLLNQNRFSLRRGRLRVDREWEYSSLTLELDATKNAKTPWVKLA